MNHLPKMEDTLPSPLISAFYSASNVLNDVKTRFEVFLDPPPFDLRSVKNGHFWPSESSFWNFGMDAVGRDPSDKQTESLRKLP